MKYRQDHGSDFANLSQHSRTLTVLSSYHGITYNNIILLNSDFLKTVAVKHKSTPRCAFKNS